MTKKVLVLAGGFSAEREVSLVSGKGVAEALRGEGYDVIEHDLVSTAAFLEVLKNEKPDVVFNALHGNWGEDGAIQAFLDFMQVPYTHSGMEASMMGMNKLLTKQICCENGVATAAFETMTFAEYQAHGTCITYPYVVKPRNDGSSVGVYIIRKPEDISQVNYEDPERALLVEKYIPGHEITVAVINGKACAVTELKSNNRFYDYEAKYTAGMTRHVLPAQLPQEVTETAMRYAEKVHALLGCNTVSRSDFRYNSQDGVVFLEVNTNPGMTPLSLVPEQAKYVGISYGKLCALLVENASCRTMVLPDEEEKKCQKAG